MKVHRQPASLRHQVQNLLREEIISGRLKPNQRLVEKHLCSEMEISRTLLREALRQLEAEGLVKLIPHRGAVVASVSYEDARQIYQVRCILEVQAVEHFVEYAFDEDLSELKTLAIDIRKCKLEELSGTEILALKQRFYHIILDIKENNVLRGILDMLNNRISLLRALSLGQTGRSKLAFKELQTIIEAISCRDSAMASEATKSHINNASDNVLSLLKHEKW